MLDLLDYWVCAGLSADAQKKRQMYVFISGLNAGRYSFFRNTRSLTPFRGPPLKGLP
jgi:hypothetical protein